jgi:heme/copper-type cytochrome/quinol oxidase subunit 1
LYSKTLTWIHVLITIVTFGLFALILFFGEGFLNPMPRRYYEFSKWNSSGYNSFVITIAISIFVLLLGQIIFVVNLIAGLFKRKTKKGLP